MYRNMLNWKLGRSALHVRAAGSMCNAGVCGGGNIGRSAQPQRAQHARFGCLHIQVPAQRQQPLQRPCAHVLCNETTPGLLKALGGLGQAHHKTPCWRMLSQLNADLG